ncbi:MAG: ATP-dependent zinc metalloprotease FtsH [Candidatus Pacebacteria bacterium]|nr:ATP-dependent zinc metalloprotease FtsH [Candidatus Paceibacterota bacterium]
MKNQKTLFLPQLKEAPKVKQPKKNLANRKKPKQLEVKIRLNLKKIFLWLFIIFTGASFLFSFASVPVEDEISLSQLITDIKSEKVKEVAVEDDRLLVDYGEKKIAFSRKEPGQSLTELFRDAGIDPDAVGVVIKDTSLSKIWLEILGTFLPLALMAVFFLWLFRQARGAQEGIFSFGRSKAKLFAKGKQSVSFKDVAGVEEAKKELEEVVDFLKRPGKYRALGARTPKGVILVGPSGTGKTLLAKAVAGEAGVPFFSMAGSEFMEMLVGVGASRVRDLFNNAKKASPAIIFIDEIDAIGRQRGTGFAGGHDEREQTLNQILVEMDGFNPNDNVIVLAATNRGDLLDPALLRPGRFDRRVVLDMPDIEDRQAILGIHARGKPFVQGLDWERVAKRTVGFSGADLENMLNEAAISAAREARKAIEMKDIEEAALKVKLGPEKKRLQSEDDRKMTAYHEGGHAVVTYNLPHMDPVHRISIVSRGIAMGFTMIPPKKDRYNETQSHLLETVASLLGGRAAEEVVFKEFTAGGASDIDKATSIARQMVVNLGMSALGPIYLGPQIDISEWGRSWIEPVHLSSEMQAGVDKEIRKIISDCYQKALEIVKQNREKLDKVAEALLKKETLEEEEFEKIMKPEKAKIKKSN